MKSFVAIILKIGVNPYVLLPDDLLTYLFKKAQKEKGPIPVKMAVGKKEFIQNLVFYGGKWRLYLNGPMRDAAKKDVGDEIRIKIDYDPVERKVPLHSSLQKLLENNQSAKSAFDKLSPSRQAEISKYLNALKTNEAVERNIKKIMQNLQNSQD